MSYAMDSKALVGHSENYIQLLLRDNPSPGTTYLVSTQEPGEFERQLIKLASKYKIPIQSYTVANESDWDEFWYIRGDDTARGIIFSGEYKPIWVTEKLRRMDPYYDIDNMVYGTPAVVEAVSRTIEYFPMLVDSIVGAPVLVIGRSDTVGKRLAGMLLDLYSCEVTVTHTAANRPLKDALRMYNWIFSTIPPTMEITPEDVRNHSYFFDIGGVLKIPDDEHFEIGDDMKVKVPNSIYYTPKKGGIGPLTTHILIERILAQQNRR